MTGDGTAGAVEAPPGTGVAGAAVVAGTEVVAGAEVVLGAVLVAVVRSPGGRTEATWSVPAAALVVALGRLGRELARGELARRLLHHQLFFGRLEAHHVYLTRA